MIILFIFGIILIAAVIIQWHQIAKKDIESSKKNKNYGESKNCGRDK